jgi:hypothetical protein
VLTFPTDWKDADFPKFGEMLRIPYVETQPVTRTHVGIDSMVGSALDGILFTTVARSTKGLTWRLRVDAEAVEPSFRARFFAMLEAGPVGPIGRTDARATFTQVKAEAPTAPTLPGHADLAAFTLVTPALLTDPLAPDVAASTRAHIEAVTGGKLVRSFGTSHLAGRYLATRHRAYGEPYYPFVPTAPGATFLIENGVPAKLARIARLGLPPIPLTGGVAHSWRTCPYMNENGYGEVRFNLIRHVEWAGG